MRRPRTLGVWIMVEKCGGVAEWVTYLSDGVSLAPDFRGIAMLETYYVGVATVVAHYYAGIEITSSC
jgi:hypothetical protein